MDSLLERSLTSEESKDGAAIRRADGEDHDRLG